MNSDISPIVTEKAPLILAEIKKAQSILLHCHPSPDPDSVGSTLATKFALEAMGKKVTLIKGDSDIPEAFLHFPGAANITQKNFFEIDHKQFDLFIVLDSGSIEQISRRDVFPNPFPISTIVIDHHASNPGYGSLINLVDPTYPATAQILYDLFTIWQVNMTHDIAANLFMGIYTDTGGFKYPGTTAKTFTIVSALIEFIPDFTSLISTMENSHTRADLEFRGLVLNSIKTFFADTVALSVVTYEMLQEKNIPITSAKAGSVSSSLRTVQQWNVVGVLVEVETGVVNVSFRSKDAALFDVSKLAVALGGGGHKAAAGVVLKMKPQEAVDLVVSKIKELYNL